MKKFSIISLIISLILFTAFIKNSTKRIDDEIYSLKENIRILKRDLENVRLEHDYLSSADKLLKLQTSFFDNELIKKDIKDIKEIILNKNQFDIRQFKFTNDE